MHIISRKALQEFWEKHPDSEMPLKTWFKIIKCSRYRSFSHLRETFKTADKVGHKIVFNIAGNKYRLITIVHFQYAKVYIRYIMTHREYDRGVWRDE